MIKKFVKKAQEVPGIHWTGKNLAEARKFLPKDLSYFGTELHVTTLNGMRIAVPGDYIVKYDDELGVHYRVYKPDYFKTYYEEKN